MLRVVYAEEPLKELKNVKVLWIKIAPCRHKSHTNALTELWGPGGDFIFCYVRLSYLLGVTLITESD